MNIHNGVVIKQLNVDGFEYDLRKLHTSSTNLFIRLNERIPPDSDVRIELEWENFLPHTPMSRQGAYYNGSHFIAYWYPKINVYDDIQGWNTIGFQGNAEFYSEYVDYEVESTLQGNYLVWSSGLHNNAEDIMTDKYLKRLSGSKIKSRRIGSNLLFNPKLRKPKGMKTYF